MIKPKVGEAIKVKGSSFIYTVLQVLEGGVIAIHPGDEGWLQFKKWDQLILPEAPKAIAGQVYVEGGNYWYGLADGRIGRGGVHLKFCPERFEVVALDKT